MSQRGRRNESEEGERRGTRVREGAGVRGGGGKGSDVRGRIQMLRDVMLGQADWI